MIKAIGVWTPRTKGHLNEFDNLLKYAKFPYKKKIKGTFKGATYTELTTGKNKLRYYDFGLLFLYGKNPSKTDFMRISAFLENIYKRGAPVPSLGKTHFESKGTIHKIEIDIIKKSISDLTKTILNLHRDFWEQLDNIRDKATPAVQEVGELKDKAAEIQEVIYFIETRLKQVSNHFDLIKRIYKKDLSEMENKNIETTFKYLQELWNLTNKYTFQTFKLLDILYKEIQEKELQSIKTITFLFSILSLIRMVIKTPVTFFELIKILGFALLIAYFVYTGMQKLVKVTRKFRKITFHVRKIEDMERSKI